MSARRRKYLMFSAVACLVVAGDLGTKAAVGARLAVGDPPLVVVSRFFQIVRVHNTGAVGELLKGHPKILIGVTVVAMAVILWMLAQTACEKTLETVSLGLLFGGALGNLFDRVRYGYVRDFLDFHIGEGRFRHYPTFNVADAALVIGAGILILALWRQKGEKAKGAAGEIGS